MSRILVEANFEVMSDTLAKIAKTLKAEVPAKWVPHPTDKVTMLTSWGFNSAPPADESFDEMRRWIDKNPFPTTLAATLRNDGKFFVRAWVGPYRGESIDDKDDLPYAFGQAYAAVAEQGLLDTDRHNILDSAKKGPSWLADGLRGALAQNLLDRLHRDVPAPWTWDGEQEFAARWGQGEITTTLRVTEGSHGEYETSAWLGPFHSHTSAAVADDIPRALREALTCAVRAGVRADRHAATILYQIANDPGWMRAAVYRAMKQEVHDAGFAVKQLAFTMNQAEYRLERAKADLDALAQHIKLFEQRTPHPTQEVI